MLEVSTTKYFRGILLTSLVALFPEVSLGMESFRDKYLSGGAKVSHVKVIEGKGFEVAIEGVSDICGFNYVSKKIGGESEYVKFSSPFPLVLGDEYLVVFGRHKADKERGLTVDWPEEYQSAFSQCEKHLEGPSLGEEEFFRVLDFPYDLEGKWVLVEDDRVRFEHAKPVRRSNQLDFAGDVLLVPFDALMKEVVK